MEWALQWDIIVDSLEGRRGDRSHCAVSCLLQSYLECASSAGGGVRLSVEGNQEWPCGRGVIGVELRRKIKTITRKKKERRSSQREGNIKHLKIWEVLSSSVCLQTKQMSWGWWMASDVRETDRTLSGDPYPCSGVRTSSCRCWGATGHT